MAGLKSIYPAPSFGSDLTIFDYEGKIDSVELKLAEYQDALAALDEMRSQFAGEEAELNQFSRRYLSGIEAQYGPDSSEYEMAGDTRKSERRRPIRRAAAGSSSRKS